MRRYIPLIVLIVVAAAIVVWQAPRLHRMAPPPVQPAGPLQPPAQSVQAATQFLSLWSQGDVAGVYQLLSAGMKKMVSQADFGQMMSGRKFTDPQPVANVETAQAAYVIYRVKAGAPAQGEKALAGYSLLLKKEQAQWRVAQIQEEEKLSAKYEELRLSPGKDGGWTVTYQNEKGQVSTLTLPGM